MKNLLLLLFGLLFYPAFSQVQLKGKITDAESGETIPYANVYLKNQPIGTTAFRDGSFSLKLDSASHDSIIFSIIGYEPKSLFLPSVINKKFVTVKLEPTQEELKEVKVLPRKLKSYEAGLVKSRASTGNGTWVDKPEARFIPNEYQLSSFVKSIAVYVRKQGIPEAPFRVNLLKVDRKTGGPGEPLAKRDFITKAVEPGNEWVTIEFHQELIIFPTEGFFVVVQSLPIDSIQLEEYKERLPDFEEWEVKTSAPVFGYSFEPYADAARDNWSYYNEGRGWRPFWRDNYPKLDSVSSGITSGRASSLMIKAEINYYADQKLKVKDLKTKRAVKKVFDRPDENTLKYPQSIPSYLLSSLKQAFEANDLAYACSYLVYYDDKDELEETMAFLESMKDTLGEARLTEKEIENVKVLLSSLEAELQNLKPSDGKRFIFGLKLKDKLFYFQNKDGVWKINPRSTSLLQNREIKIPARF
ncbi:hypothetical protein Oweho_2994 [Owenweeksia hongkongensis DSM 17368]|uniref:Carboxypeptidase-like regulatory domain-containing protein n=1 Tax=Owenweeksia hongkongensis (strain DSM 17368 / CIP 108786 / JCM 12287 / NRRL B-23963 / UST20020801) TaxID=926562 RepID=G8R1Z9_OWEHD|nr:carboxypeptidase-like regulatory domain-containing protein [Owenweeksia hongkongensis]AEV33949.1 hypothetical protein Oweho_2994 [Owenweeksia hongkongensis DSM 17368]